MSDFTLSIIVPCYNEATTIEACLGKLSAFSGGQPFALEIIVVDDASTDASAQILDRVAGEQRVNNNVNDICGTYPIKTGEHSSPPQHIYDPACRGELRALSGVELVYLAVRQMRSPAVASINPNSRINTTIKIFKHEKNLGKGAALRTGFAHATGDFIGIHDADDEYDPRDYLMMLDPLLAGKADVVYGSRHLRPDTRRVLYFWHTWMNNALTYVSNMFTNLDITDMETCYKLFRREVIKSMVPHLREERFGFEPEITARVADAGCRVYECAISYNPRSYEEGKKIGWKDGMRALYCIFHYSAHTAPLPMQILIYLFIGGVSMLADMGFFMLGNFLSVPVDYAIVGAFVLAAAINYVLCILILFKHKARWRTWGELVLYGAATGLMGLIDFGVTRVLIAWSGRLILPKFMAAVTGFVGNFLLRKWLVFPERKKR